MLERNKLRLGFLSSLAGGFLLTLAFPFLFGSQIYDSPWVAVTGTFIVIVR